MPEQFEYFENQPENPVSKTEDIHSTLSPRDVPDANTSEPFKEGEPSKNGEWIDKGIQNVPVRKIDTSDSSVKGMDDFKKVPHSEVVRGFHALETEVRPAVEKGAKSDDFRSMDQRRGLEYPQGSQKIYESFYGQNAIRLEKNGDIYKVINGYHRLYVANELKIPTVPARVIEKRS
jgi:hypothetical protein